MRIALFLLCMALSLTMVSQNIEDAYKDDWIESPEFFSDDRIVDYDGEYQIFLDKLFWSHNIGNPSQVDLSEAATSFSIEVVSFPFIPKNEFSPANKSRDRILTTVVADYYDYYGRMFSYHNNELLYRGKGWEYNGYKIYQKLDNINNCDDFGSNNECEGHYSLASAAFDNPFIPGPGYYNICILPHTILKHTIYFHCGTSIEDPIIDSIYWIYDNTRGRMSYYPFDKPDRFAPPDLNVPLDVVFRPTFNHYVGSVDYPPDDHWNENSEYYHSGLTNNTGSVNYFPQTEILDVGICDQYPIYPTPDYSSVFVSNHNNPQTFTSGLVHPPPYVLLDAPLLNYHGVRYAGYFSSNGSEQQGSLQEYRIEDPFDLSIINPTEKIIYNPSMVSIECDLTFPCGYQFLTLRGKYADRYGEVHNGLTFSSQYWDGVPYFNFEYERDYPVPVNSDVNSKPVSVYEIRGGRTLTIEPYVIIMDAYFKGTNHADKSVIKYIPEYTYGNWDYDPETVRLVPLPANIIAEFCIPTESKNDKVETSQKEYLEENEDKFLRINNSGSYNPEIQVNLGENQSAIVRVFSYSGKAILERNISQQTQVINCTGFKRGVYHVSIIVDGNVSAAESFVKM